MCACVCVGLYPAIIVTCLLDFVLELIISEINERPDHFVLMLQGLQETPAETPQFAFDSTKTTEAPVAPAFASQVSGGGNVAAAKGVVPSVGGYQNIVKLQKAWAVSPPPISTSSNGSRIIRKLSIKGGLRFEHIQKGKAKR